MRKLIDLKEGDIATVTGMEGDARFLNRIVSIGITPGGKVEILRNEKKMPLLLYSRDSMIALRRAEGSRIFVEVK